MGHDATLAGGTISARNNAWRICGSLAAASAAYVPIPAAVSAADALGPMPASCVRSSARP